MLLNPAERNPVKAADWMELKTLFSDSGNISFEGLRSDIEVDGTLADEEDIETVPHEFSEHLVASAAAEIKRRARIAKDAYPFESSAGVLKWTRDSACTPYIFCLLLADREYYIPGDRRSVKLFEHLVCHTVQKYLGGEAVSFGEPRDTMVPGIIDAIGQLAALTGNRKLKDGYDYNARDKDIGLDVVGWRSFSDNRWGQVELYVQCTTEQHWQKKKGDLNLDEWRLILRLAFIPIKTLAIPYVVASRDWDRETPGMLLIDRLRIVSILRLKELPEDEHNWWAWCEERIEEGRLRG